MKSPINGVARINRVVGKFFFPSIAMNGLLGLFNSRKNFDQTIDSTIINGVLE